MKKISIVLTALLLTTVAVFAQTDKESKAILDKAIAQFEKGGVEMNGVVHYGSDGAFALSLKMDHERFYGHVADFAIWFDGKTQWFLRSGEIYISEPAPNEQLYANPYLMMKDAEKLFNISKADGKLPEGAASGILLTPRTTDELQSARIFFDKESRPVSIKAVLRNGNSANVEITSFKNAQKYKSGDFSCDTKKHDAEIIDMR